MTKTRTYQRAFNGGEISPDYFGAAEDPKYINGLSLCRNYIALPHGPATNRSGFAFVRAARYGHKRARVIPFVYSTTQTMVVELGEGYIRFHSQGATLLHGGGTAWSNATEYEVGDLASSGGTTYYCIEGHTNQAPPNAAFWYAMPSDAYEIPSPYLAADLMDIHYTQSGDVMTLVHPSYPEKELRREGALLWKLTDISMAPTISPPYSAGGSAAAINHSYKVTAVFGSSTTGLFGAVVNALVKESAPSPVATASADLTLDGSRVNLSWPAVQKASSYRIYKLSGGLYGYIGTASGNAFADNGNITPQTTKTPPSASSATGPASLSATATTVSGATSVAAAATVGTGTTEYTYVVTSVGPKGESIASAPATVSNDLLDSDANYNTISWPAVAGALRYNVYKESNGLFGYIGQAEGLSFKDGEAGIIPDISITPPRVLDPFNGEGNYPAAVAYFEQRRVFGGTTNQPSNFWATRPGTESDLSASIPTRDDDAIAYRIAATQANTIRHLVPVGDLIALTSSTAFRITALGDVLTPTTTSARPQARVGANNTQPVVTDNNNIVFIADRGGRPHEMAYNDSVKSHVTGDLCHRTAHLFNGYDIIDMAYAKAPYSIIWCVSTSGLLLGLTYVPDEQVGAWHRHDTDGAFESVCVVAEGDEDAVYVVVQRDIDGSIVRYIERMSTRRIGQIADLRALESDLSADVDAFLVDSGVSYSGAPQDEFAGLDHLEGEEVAILADGVPHPRQTVVAGSVVLDVEASVVHIGLPITSDMAVPPPMFNTPGTALGRPKNPGKIFVRVYRTAGFWAGPSLDRLDQAKMNSITVPGDAPNLETGVVELDIDGLWENDGVFFIRQTDPLPVTIVSLSAEMEVGG